MASELYLNAYIPSAGEYDIYFNKFIAFMGAKLSEKAKKNGTYSDDTYDAGNYFLRTALAWSSDKVFYGCYNGARDWSFSDRKGAGLRVAFQLIYNPENSLVKGCQTKTQTSLVYDNGKPEYTGNGERKEVTSKAPIVMFGGKECIWLNKEECESGKDKTMKLWTLELVDCAKPYYIDGKEEPNNDFGKAKALLEQCESALVEGCTKEELDMLVTVKMSKEDNYEKVEPILEKAKANEEKTVEGLFEALLNNEIDEETLRKGLKEISKTEREKEGASKETAKALETKIAREAKQFNKKLAEREKVGSAFDSVDKSIDDLKLGGK